jgi:N-acetylglucosaminyl-diphospho-decaprenol L-rhamnosyltransferase
MSQVRIGIVSWNTADLLDRCLAALPAACEGLAYDVVVVDNHSADESVAVATRHGATVVANDDNRGYARAMNQALQLETEHPEPDVLIALNPDTDPAPGTLRTLVERLRAQPIVGLVVPRLSNEDGSLQHSAYRFPTPVTTVLICLVPPKLQRGPLVRHWWLEGATPHDRTVDIDWAIGAVHVIRADALGEDLPYCERWFMYVEDVDLCWRLQQKGWRVRLEGDIEVTHVGNAAGAQAWGAGRTARWWAATYDWVRFRRGEGSARRYATINTIGVNGLLLAAKLRHKVQPHNQQVTANIAEYTAILPAHADMMRHPASAHDPADSYPAGGIRP